MNYVLVPGHLERQNTFNTGPATDPGTPSATSIQLYQINSADPPERLHPYFGIRVQLDLQKPAFKVVCKRDSLSDTAMRPPAGPRRAKEGAPRSDTQVTLSQIALIEDGDSMACDGGPCNAPTITSSMTRLALPCLEPVRTRSPAGASEDPSA